MGVGLMDGAVEIGKYILMCHGFFGEFCVCFVDIRYESDSSRVKHAN